LEKRRWVCGEPGITVLASHGEELWHETARRGERGDPASHMSVERDGGVASVLETDRPNRT
jgi:hypothetical protein